MKLSTATSLGTVFPLVFDDVTPQRLELCEEVLKRYWEIEWKEDYVLPQIIVSSNSSRLKEWAKSRVKRIDFDIQFAPNECNKEKLAQLFVLENPIFKWFSHLYLKYLEQGESPGDDELQLARTIMKELYIYTKRVLPPFFPEQPIETLYDPGRREWNDLLKLGKAKITTEKERLLIHFSFDMQPREIREYQAYLPQTVKYKRRGNTLIIQSPTEFNIWLKGEIQHHKSFIDRLFKR